MICRECSTENVAGRKFCAQCGARLAVVCPACGTGNLPGDRFCGECGGSLVEETPPRLPEPAAPETELRLVSVLFADLVGFTPLSEHRDPEEVRAFLTGYFEEARTVVERFGGKVEKFIGDAVMAVWGLEQAREDDAERAVRAGLDLVEAVGKLGAGAGVPELSLRAGVLTGEAAVGQGGEGQGLVMGDLVNSASRVQALAEAGTVLVGEGTYRTTGRSIAYQELGERTVKGRETPLRLYRAAGLLAMRRGEGRAEALEPPFVGRAEELRMLKDLLHATGREGRSRLASIVGIAGIGKSRLVWEFQKYVDGLVEDVYWHEGRSPAYGEGVAFWALGEMVRRRAGIGESDDPERAAAELAETLAEYVPDDEERRWLEPRLGALLGVEEAPGGDREELFAAFRTFFERIAERGTTVLVFEDLQWADPGLLDFVDELPDRWRDRPILVLTLARPELLERRPGWGSGRHRVVSAHLGPLAEEEMRDLVEGLVPGLSEHMVDRILERAAGVPLYAVELVRMLILEEDLVPEGGGYRLVREPTELAVPDSLAAVIGARLDRLDPAARAVVQDAAVLGQAFTADGLAALTGTAREELEPILADLVRKELLQFASDPRASDRGRYGFVQSLIREVAHGRLGREERRVRHLAAARYLESLEDEELAPVVASHYLDAYRATTDEGEAEELATRARSALRHAAERAASLHSHEQVLALCRQAFDIPGGPDRQAPLRELAGASALALARFEEAEEHALAALERYRTSEDVAGTARSARLYATVFMRSGQPERAIEILEGEVRAWDGEEADPDLAGLLTDLARAYLLTGRTVETLEVSDRALTIAERLELFPLVGEALVTRGTTLGDLGRLREGIALLREGLALARRFGLSGTEARAHANLGYLLYTDEPGESLESYRRGLELARRTGHREGELFGTGNVVGLLSWQGKWEEARELLAEAEQREMPEMSRLSARSSRAVLDAWQGAVDDASRELEEIRKRLGGETDPQLLRSHDIQRAWADLAAGRVADAYRRAAERARLDPFRHFDPVHTAARAALWWGDREALLEVHRMVEGVPRPGRAVRATRVNVEAGLAAVEGDVERARELFEEAAALWEELGLPFDLGLCRAEQAQLLGDQEAREEARGILEDLGAEAFLRQLGDQPSPRAAR